MKQGTAISRIVMLLFAGAILLYFFGAAWRSLHDPYPTTQIYEYTVDDTIEATGYLARTEQVIAGGAGVVRLLPAEGEKVRAGAVLAALYDDQASVERSERLEELTAEVEQMEQAQIEAGAQIQSDDPAGETVDALVELRAGVAAGDFTHLEAETAQFKGAVIRQALRYGDPTDLTAALDAARAEIAALRAQTAQSTGSVTAPVSGVFSGQVDGYETILLPELLSTLSPSTIDALPGLAEAVPATAVGKLITSSKWYFVCVLTQDQARRLTEGSTITARFSRDWSGEVDMTVERLGAPENGRCAVVLSSTRYLSQVTLLRRQSVELVFSTKTGLRVPAKAVRVETDTVKDKQTGAESQVQVTCVYVQTGVKADRKPVEILSQGEDYYLVAPLISDKATQDEEKKALRAGDAVIVASEPIWDGKIVG